MYCGINVIVCHYAASCYYFTFYFDINGDDWNRTWNIFNMLSFKYLRNVKSLKPRGNYKRKWNFVTTCFEFFQVRWWCNSTNLSRYWWMRVRNYMCKLSYFLPWCVYVCFSYNSQNKYYFPKYHRLIHSVLERNVYPVRCEQKFCMYFKEGLNDFRH